MKVEYLKKATTDLYGLTDISKKELLIGDNQVDVDVFNTSEFVSGSISKIISRVESNTAPMPPSPEIPLDVCEIDLIKNWQENDFTE